MIMEPNFETPGAHADPNVEHHSDNAFILVSPIENPIMSGVHIADVEGADSPGPLRVNGTLLTVGRWNWIVGEQRWMKA